MLGTPTIPGATYPEVVYGAFTHHRGPGAVEIRDLAVYDALLGDTDIAAPLPNAAPGGAGGLDLTLAEVSA